MSVLLPLFLVLALLLAVLSSMIYYRRKDVTVKCLCFECHTRRRNVTGSRDRKNGDIIRYVQPGFFRSFQEAPGAHIEFKKASKFFQYT